MSIHIHMLRTDYTHWGAYSGINQYLKHVDQTQFKINMRLVPNGDQGFPVNNRMVRHFLRLVLKMRGMKWYRLSDLAAELKVLSCCRSHPADIIHYLDGEHTANFLPGAVKKFYGIRPRIMATYHQPPELLEALIRRDVIRQLDCITVVSPDQAAYFKEWLQPDKVRLILHGIDAGYFRPGNTGKVKKKFRCITVGHWLRDFAALRKVAEKLINNKAIEFHIVSDQASELADLPNVTVQSGVDDARLLDLYQQSDLLFLPLIQCTANNVLLEAIACGLPVVSTALTSVKAYAPGGEAVLVQGNDAGQFAEAILQLFHHPERRKHMGQQARKRAEELDWRKITPQYESIYAELAEK